MTFEDAGGLERPGSFALGALVFGAGIGALATEITASRLLAPYFGSSTIVWANLIGIVLAALAVGYWLGGRLADRRPEPRSSASIVLVAAVCVALIPFAAKPFLDFTVEGLDTASAGAVVGSFLAVLLLCAPPVVLLGMVSPFAIRLAVSSIATAGSGRGAPLRALDGRLAARHLPPGAPPHSRRSARSAHSWSSLRCWPRPRASCSGRATSSCRRSSRRSSRFRPGAVKAEEGLLHEETSYHQYIRVVERPDGRRLLRLNEGVAVHSVWRPDTS